MLCISYLLLSLLSQLTYAHIRHCVIAWFILTCEKFLLCIILYFSNIALTYPRSRSNNPLVTRPLVAPRPRRLPRILRLLLLARPPLPPPPLDHCRSNVRTPHWFTLLFCTAPHITTLSGYHLLRFFFLCYFACFAHLRTRTYPHFFRYCFSSTYLSLCHFAFPIWLWNFIFSAAAAPAPPPAAAPGVKRARALYPFAGQVIAIPCFYR